MKYIILYFFSVVAFLFTSDVYAQEYKQSGNIKYNSNSVIIENYKLQKGDTVYLGFGSGADKQFIFVFMKPNVLTYNPGKGFEGVPAMFANSALVIKSIGVKKVMGNDAVLIDYTINGKKVNIGIDLYNAYKSGEVKGFSNSCIIQNPTND